MIGLRSRNSESESDVVAFSLPFHMEAEIEEVRTRRGAGIGSVIRSELSA